MPTFPNSAVRKGDPLSRKTLLAVEAMPLGVQRLAENAARLGHQLVLLAEDPSLYIGTGNAFVLQFPTRDRDALESYVAQHVGEIGNIFSCTDTWGVVAAELREKFKLRSRFSSRRLAQFRDKLWIQKNTDENSTETELSFPRIIKPRCGTGSTDIHLVMDDEDYRNIIANSENPEGYISQIYYRGPIYSAEVWSNGSIFRFFGITNRIMTQPPLFLEYVKTFPHEAGTAWEKQVKNWTRRLLARLEYDLGLAHVEFIETKHGFQLVEINPRMAGALITPAIDHCTNFDPYALAITDALNIDPVLPDRRIVTGGHSHVTLYADRIGTLASVDGVDALVAYPGKPVWLKAKEIGAAISDVSSYRARIGNVSALGPSPGVAQDRALAAAACIRSIIE